MKRFSSIGMLILVGLVSFLFFFYLMFPYTVLREAVVTKLSAATGMSLRLDKLTPHFPLGVRIDGVAVDQPGRKGIKLRRVDVSISPLNLLFASLRAKLYVEDEHKGQLTGSVSLPLFGLLQQKGVIPSSVDVTSRDFAIKDLAEYFLAEYSHSEDINMLVAPLLTGLQVGGTLNADVALEINTNDAAKTSGNLSLSLFNFTLGSRAGELPIDNQEFNKAIISAEISKGTLTFAKESGFVSNDLLVEITGNITQKPELSESHIEAELGIELSKNLKEQFGFIISAITNTDVQQKLTVKISGPFSPQPSVVVL